MALIPPVWYGSSKAFNIKIFWDFMKFSMPEFSSTMSSIPSSNSSWWWFSWWWFSWWWHGWWWWGSW
jgi:hypothetical protein